MKPISGRPGLPRVRSAVLGGRRGVDAGAFRSVRGAVLLLLGLILVTASAAACLPAGTRGSASPVRASGAVKTQAPTLVIASSEPTGPRSFVPPTATPAPTFAVYTVARGDNLNSIALKFATSARSIAFWNRTTYPSLDPESDRYRPDRLEIGWTLFVLPNVILTDEEAPPLPGPSVPEAIPDDAPDPDGDGVTP